MSRETSPCIVGDFWLDKRRDGVAPDIWQIATYAPGSRSVVYSSTKCRTVEQEAAEAKLYAHVDKIRSKSLQTVDAASVVPQLLLYIKEKEEAGDIVNIAQSKSSMRAFIGFLMQDEVGVGVKFSGLSQSVWKRFVTWRRGEHSYSVPWGDKVYNHRSAGVKGETIQRNLEDVRAALNYAEDQERVTAAPKVRSVDKKLRSPPRDVQLTIKQLGAIVGYTSGDIAMNRWIRLMIATGMRPEAALAFDPLLQDHGALLDLHPPAWKRTAKVNPWVPAIGPLRPILNDWKADPHTPAKSRKTAWRTMRRALGLPSNIVAKTIRHTIATELRRRSVPGAEISGLLGHPDPDMNPTSAVYAKYDPAYLAKAARALTKIFLEVEAEARRWSADHLRTNPQRGKPISIDKRVKKPQDSGA